jgi:hypothetical protein
MTQDMTHWFILLTADGVHVLPRARTFRNERARAERAQQRNPGSRLVEILTPALG